MIWRLQVIKRGFPILRQQSLHCGHGLGALVGGIQSLWSGCWYCLSPVFAFLGTFVVSPGNELNIHVVAKRILTILPPQVSGKGDVLGPHYPITPV